MNLSPTQEDRARRLHAEAVIVLAHDHFPPPADLEALRQGNVAAKILMAVVDARLWAKTTEDYQRSAAETAGWFAAACETYRGIRQAIENTPGLALVRSADDILEAKRQGKVGILLGAEGGKLVEDRVENLQDLYDLGLRHILLTWAFDNLLSAGELNREGKGLTELGRQVVHEMNRLGVVIDTTHLSRPAMREILALSSRPVLNSHTTWKGLADRLPALTEEEIRAVAERGGVVALHFMTHMLTGQFSRRATLDDLLNQLDALVRFAGVEGVALGPDYLPYDEDFKRNTGQPSLSFPEGLESSAGLLNLVRGMVARGYDDDAVGKMLGGNLLRLFREVL